MYYVIKVRKFLFFWSKYTVINHWIETSLNGVQIPPRLVMIDTNNDAMIVIANILAKDWSIYGLQNAIHKRTRPKGAVSEPKRDDGEPILSGLSESNERGQSTSDAVEAAKG